MRRFGIAMAGPKAQRNKTPRIIRHLDGAELEELLQTSPVNVQDLATSVIANNRFSAVIAVVK